MNTDLLSRQKEWSPLWRALISLGLVILIGIIFNADGTFLQWDTHRDMLRQISVFGILACGMTLVIVCAGIDLSVGSLLGLAAVSFSIFAMHWGWPAWLSIAAVLLIGTLFGAVSGGVIARFNVQPFIATLGMMVFARGVAKWISGGEKISTAIQLADGTYKYVEPPHVFNFISSGILNGNISVVTILFVVCVIFCWIVLERTYWGRYLYAIGGNEEAARLSGIPVREMKIAAYGLSGFFCAVAGICQAAQELQGDPEAGATYELTAIAMVVIGGTSLRGGNGSILLTLLGALIIGYLEKILSINAVGEESRLMLTGAIIVGAVMLQRNSQSLG